MPSQKSGEPKRMIFRIVGRAVDAVAGDRDTEIDAAPRCRIPHQNMRAGKTLPLVCVVLLEKPVGMLHTPRRRVRRHDHLAVADRRDRRVDLAWRDHPGIGHRFAAAIEAKLKPAGAAVILVKLDIHGIAQLTAKCRIHRAAMTEAEVPDGVVLGGDRKLRETDSLLRQEFKKTLRHRGTAESLDALVNRDVHGVGFAFSGKTEMSRRKGTEASCDRHAHRETAHSRLPNGAAPIGSPRSCCQCCVPDRR